MAIKKFENKNAVEQSDFDGVLLGLSNGDLNALSEVVSKWNFKDEENFIKFAIALMIKSGENKKIYIEDSQWNDPQN